MTRTSRQESRARAHAPPRARTQCTPRPNTRAPLNHLLSSRHGLLACWPSFSIRLCASRIASKPRALARRVVQSSNGGCKLESTQEQWIYIRSETLERARADDVSRFGLAPGGPHGVPDSMEESLRAFEEDECLGHQAMCSQATGSTPGLPIRARGKLIQSACVRVPRSSTFYFDN